MILYSEEEIKDILESLFKEIDTMNRTPFGVTVRLDSKEYRKLKEKYGVIEKC